MGLLRMYKNRKRVLGMNERNLGYIRPFNSPTAKDIVDNKLLTKQVLEDSQIPTPTLLAHIDTPRELKAFDWDSLPKSFVMKPVQGLEGAGIEIFYNRDKQGNWIKSDGSKISVDRLKMMVLDIMDGKYSLHNQKDSVFFEERVKMHKAFKYYAYKGAPDVRIILFNNIPIMGYVRLPTRESQGKGNLAQGAIGAAIDMVTGTTTSAIIGKGTLIETIPGTKLSVSGLKIPYWNSLLKIAIQAQKATNLGYAAVDFLIDRERGPVIIELNARPGLSIQIANRDGLRWRLRKAAGIKVPTATKGVRIAKDLFGGQIEEGIEKLSGKQVVSHIEPIEIISEKQTKIPTLALIDTSRRTTTLTAKLAKSAGIIQEDTEVDEPIIADISFNLAGNLIDTDCRIVKSPVRGYRMLVGRKDLGDYLVDIRKVATGKAEKQRETMLSTQGLSKPENIDNALEEISSKIFIIRNIRPTNLISERKKFKSTIGYNPQFEYPPVQIDTDKLLERLNSLQPDTNTDIGRIFAEKIAEMKKEIYLIEAISDDEKFASRSKDLYGHPDNKTFQRALRTIKETDSIKPNKRKGKILKRAEVQKLLQSSLNKIGFDGKIIFTKTGPKKAAVLKHRNEIQINSNYKFTRDKLLGTIAHEIQIHLRRALEGKKQPYKIFSYGTARYIEIEEGLAVLNKSNVLDSKQPIRNAAIMYASAYMNNISSFYETYKFLKGLGLSEHNAFNFTMRTKKGIKDTSKHGAFLKDSLYFTGYLKVKNLTEEQVNALLESGKTHEVIKLE